MHKYLVKRILMMLPTLIGAGIFIFFPFTAYSRRYLLGTAGRIW